MESELYGRDAAFAVVDEHGRQVADDTAKGFTEEVIRQIGASIDALTINTEEQVSAQPAKPRLEIWQQYMENGEYLRAAELTEEQNYNQIDGRLNNIKPEKHKRESVIARLHALQKQIALQDRPVHEQPVMDTEIERNKK